MSELDNVKPGDILYSMGGLGNHISLHKVARVTKTLVITDSDIRISKSDGYPAGGYSYGSRHYKIATHEIMKRAKAERTAKRISKYFEKPLKVELPLEKLEQILAIIEDGATDD